MKAEAGNEGAPGPLYPVLKRAFDVAGAATGLLLFLPVGVLVALAIKLSDGGPVFFAQTRIGRHGRPFRMWKFRSMVVQADQKGLAVTSSTDRRITPVGRILRRSKLDEVPQLWNVLRGEMSFVGPRPEVPRYVALYTPQQAEILNYKPGITDVATIAFRNEEELLRGARDVEHFYVKHCLPAKIEMNLAYGRRSSVVRDLWIILQTLCPYWVGVLLLYGVTLSVCLALTYLLLSDFTFREGDLRSYLRVLPWMVIPQLICLFWQGQARGLLSYFSIPEMKRTAAALSISLSLQIPLCVLRFGTSAPSFNVYLMNLVIAFSAVCAVRMAFRLVRERTTARQAEPGGPPRRVAIVGLNRGATDLALELTQDRPPRTRVVAFFDDGPQNWQKRPYDIPVFGMPECLLNPEWHRKLDEVIIALPPENAVRIAEIESMLSGLPMTVTHAPGWLPVGVKGGEAK